MGAWLLELLNRGSPQVTAKITTLEDLGEAPPNLFDTETSGGGDQPLLKTVLLEETELRKYLLTTDPVSWPPLQDGPLKGISTTEIVVDREGKVRQIASIVSDNPGLSEDAGRAIVKMRFKPYLQNGVPVQVVSRITMPFKTPQKSKLSLDLVMSSEADYAVQVTVCPDRH